MDMTTVLGASIGTSSVFLFCCICCRYCNEYFKKNGCLYSRNEIGIDINSDDPNGPHLHAKTVIDFSIGKRKVQVAPSDVHMEKDGAKDDDITGKEKEHVSIHVKEASSDENPK
jgi:hypothetical protein